MQSARSIGLSKAWKDRYDYTNSLAGTSFHNSWRAMVFTIKGKEIGFEVRWKIFKNFIDDMHSTYQEGKRLSRLDKTKIFSKENCEWVDPGDLISARTIQFTYNGETKSLKEWCLKYDLNHSGVRLRYHKCKHYTPYEILFGKIRKSKKKMVDQAQFTKSALRIKASKMISSYKCSDKKKGFPNYILETDWFINNIIKKLCSYCSSAKNVGADRFDNSKPHSPDNIIPCCYRCNVVKNIHFSYEQMLKIGEFFRTEIDNIEIVGEA